MKKKSRTKSYIKPTIIGLSIFLGGLLIGSIDLSDDTDCKSAQANTLAAVTTETESDLPAKPSVKTIDILDSTTTSYLGDENAPITMVEFTDYQCSYCQKYYFSSFKDIIEKYVKTGKVKYITKSFPLPFHPEARPASYATYCAAEQNAKFAMHKRLFMYQNEWAYSDDSNQKFTDYALEIGLNTNAFASCLETAPKKYDKSIDADIAFAKGYKLTGTPSFLINGTPVVGALSIEKFSKVLDQAL